MVIQNKTLISERRACQLVGLSRTVLQYEPTQNDFIESFKWRRRSHNLFSPHRALLQTPA